MSRRDVTATLSQYHTILEKIIDKQRDCKSKQKRLHRQMKRIHKEYKTIKGNQRVNSVCVRFFSHQHFLLVMERIFDVEMSLWIGH